MRGGGEGDGGNKGSNRGNSGGGMTSNRGGRESMVRERGGHGNRGGSNFSAGQGRYQEDWHNPNRGGGYGGGYEDNRNYGGRFEEDYRSGNRGRSGHGSARGGNEGRTNYGNDWNTGQNQERYDSNERRSDNRGQSGFGRGSSYRQNRSTSGSDWNAGSRSGYEGYGYQGNNSRYEEGHPRHERNQKGNRQWSGYSNEVEEIDEDRQAPGFYGGSRPTGKNQEGLRKLLEDQLKDMYWAEKALTKAIPKMIEKASSADLIEALTEHEEVTKQQVKKLEEVFELLGSKAQAKKCPAMEGLIKEANEITGELDKGSVRDAGIICASQKVEHYEIATYGCLSTYAAILDEMEVYDLIEEILQEEKDADKTLSEIANYINWEAAEEEEEDTAFQEDEEEDEDDYEQEDEEDNETGEEDEEEEEDVEYEQPYVRFSAESGNSRKQKQSRQGDVSELEAVES